MNEIYLITPVLARVFVASSWYDPDGAPLAKKLYCKTRELIAGDRAERIVQIYIDETRGKDEKSA